MYINNLVLLTYPKQPLVFNNCALSYGHVINSEASDSLRVTWVALINYWPKMNAPTTALATLHNQASYLCMCTLQRISINGLVHACMMQRTLLVWIWFTPGLGTFAMPFKQLCHTSRNIMKEVVIVTLYLPAFSYLGVLLVMKILKINGMSFYTLLELRFKVFDVDRYVGWGCILNCFMPSSLPCFYAFCWSAIPTSCYIFNVFYSCNIYMRFVARHISDGT